MGNCVSKYQEERRAIRPERRGFVAGMLCGGVLVVIVWGASIWWTSRVERSPADAAVYDVCLATQQGNTVACDAFMRTYKRERAKDDVLEKILNAVAGTDASIRIEQARCCELGQSNGRRRIAN